MGRGKIEIKLIENPTNRQVTYSKRRNGIFKKAHELSVLCDAKVSLIMFSKNNKMHEYITPGLTTKKMIDQYQKALGNIDLWRPHYERMLESLAKMKEINDKLRKQIRNRVGADLDDLSFEQLRNLEEDIVSASGIIRERKILKYFIESGVQTAYKQRKFIKLVLKTISLKGPDVDKSYMFINFMSQLHVIKNRTDTCKKKVRSLEQVNGNLLLEIEKCMIHPQYHVMHEGGMDDEESAAAAAAVAVSNGASNLYAFCQHHSHLNLHHHDLRLA